MKLGIAEVKPNPQNPRVIKDDKFKKLVQSLKDFPEMAEVREVVVNTDHMILGGNMRYKAMVEAGWTEIPVKVVDWSEDKQREFIIKDNVSGGEWDWDVLANEWDSDLSGSTLIACEQTDRTCYGMELDPKYVDVIRKRYAKFIGEEDWQAATPVIRE